MPHYVTFEVSLRGNGSYMYMITMHMSVSAATSTSSAQRTSVRVALEHIAALRTIVIIAFAELFIYLLEEGAASNMILRSGGLLLSVQFIQTRALSDLSSPGLWRNCRRMHNVENQAR